jgi:uncharacterized membrane protein
MTMMNANQDYTNVSNIVVVATVVIVVVVIIIVVVVVVVVVVVIIVIKGKAIPSQAWTGPDSSRGCGSQILRQLAYEGDKVFSPTHQPPLPRRKYSWQSFLSKAE